MGIIKDELNKFYSKEKITNDGWVAHVDQLDEVLDMFSSIGMEWRKLERNKNLRGWEHTIDTKTPIEGISRVSFIIWDDYDPATCVQFRPIGEFLETLTPLGLNFIETYKDAHENHDETLEYVRRIIDTYKILYLEK